MSIPEIPFEAFPKIPRLSRQVIVTEKIDGTNAGIFINDNFEVFAASRSKWITPEADNHGFAKWVQANAEELKKLGTGMHWGEWWGAGVQRRYGLSEKRFSLFNTSRWRDGAEARPECCGVVPILWEGVFDELRTDDLCHGLATMGSVAAPGFMDPEGIVVFHLAANAFFKKLLKNDEAAKGARP